jgi:hypothetical protein
MYIVANQKNLMALQDKNLLILLMMLELLSNIALFVKEFERFRDFEIKNFNITNSNPFEDLKFNEYRPVLGGGLFESPETNPDVGFRSKPIYLAE